MKLWQYSAALALALALALAAGLVALAYVTSASPQTLAVCAAPSVDFDREVCALLLGD